VAADIDLFPIGLFRGITRDYDAHDFGISSQLSVDFRFTSHALHARTDPE
jgi:hypothetical protein